jgi:hypothetical protein
MFRSRAVLVGAVLVNAALLLTAGPLGAQDTPPAPTIHDIRITGAHELSQNAVIDAARVETGRPLPMPVDRVDDLAARIVRHYRDEGYTFANVTAAFDAASGVLSFTIDEGVIGGVEFTGVDDKLKERFADEFALRAGDVFNRGRARQALDVLLRPTRGAVRPGRIFERGAPFLDSRQLESPSYDRRRTFDIVDRNGERILLVGLYEPAGRFRIVPDLGDREDWFTSVDGFVPSLGFGAAVFDHSEFNHAYVAGHLSFKMASDRAGYALGFERPFFGSRKLYVGGELHDLTTSDDQWQVSSLEASLAAVGPRLSFRDYYRRRGVQIGAEYRPHPRIELLAVWRGERHEPLGVQSDFSFWNGDDAFRLNPSAREGRLNALIIGASIDGVGFDRESLDATYRRHQLDTLFGERLDLSWSDVLWGRTNNLDATWRIDWTSEITGEGFGGDFDYRRHIVSARYRKPLSPHQEFGARAIGGWSSGVLPPQRLFGLGGLGSVHGYAFKEVAGDSMRLVNLEYALGWRNGLKGIGFFDVGRVSSISSTDEWLKGVGFGIGIGDVRLDFGYRVNAVPSSLQVTLRFGRTF